VDHLLTLQFISCLICRRRNFATSSLALSPSPARFTSLPSSSLAKSALSNTNLVISLSPRDIAAHIFKALTIYLLGYCVLTIKSFNIAFAPPFANSLSGQSEAW
jgi:hypothetical protein